LAGYYFRNLNTAKASFTIINSKTGTITSMFKLYLRLCEKFPLKKALSECNVPSAGQKPNIFSQIHKSGICRRERSTKQRKSMAANNTASRAGEVESEIHSINNFFTYLLTRGFPSALLSWPAAISIKSISHQIPQPPNVISFSMPRPM